MKRETQIQDVGDQAMTAIKKAGSAILNGKHAIVFGAVGSIGAAVAKEFAVEGAEVFLAGRTKSNVEEISTS